MTTSNIQTIITMSPLVKRLAALLEYTGIFKYINTLRTGNTDLRF